MADLATLNNLANEARRQELRLKIARLKGSMDGHSIAVLALSGANSDAQRTMDAAQQELAALEMGAGPGVTDQFGMRSSVDNFCTEERTIGQTAVIDFVKLNPTCTEDAAVEAWSTAVLGWLPEGIRPTHNPLGLLDLYAFNLVNGQKIPDTSWPSVTGFITATDKATLLGM